MVRVPRVTHRHQIGRPLEDKYPRVATNFCSSTPPSNYPPDSSLPPTCIPNSLSSPSSRSSACLLQLLSPSPRPRRLRAFLSATLVGILFSTSRRNITYPNASGDAQCCTTVEHA